MVFSKIKGIMKKNSSRHSNLKIFLTLFFPVLLVLLTELNHMHSVEKLIGFIANKPKILIYDLLIVAAVYLTISLLTKRVYIGMLVTGVALMTASIVEYFKFTNSGTHFSVIDLAMSFNVADLGQFAEISFEPLFFTTVMLTLGFVVVAFLLNITFEIPTRRRVLTGLMTGVVCTIMVASPVVSADVYDLFELDTQNDINVFMSDEKFENNNLIAFFMQSISKQVSNAVEEPDGYSQEGVLQALNPGNDFLNEKFKSPNVILVMSESYADFRQFEQLDISPDVYAGYDKVKSEGFEGKSIVPTIGGYTVMTEFELMFGLPVKSINGYSMPHRLLDNKEQNTVAQYFGSIGYETAYVHPFNETFYSRNTIYANYGFDTMLFIEDMKQENFRHYTDDVTVFDTIIDMLKENDDATYVHTTTMQNHKPYVDENNKDDELGFYLEGVRHSSDALEDFTEQLKELDEPTIVLFIGDHYPCFNASSGVYEELGIDQSNCYKLYEQSYLLWSNYDADLTKAPQEQVSAFYLPHVLVDVIEAPQSNFIGTMLDKMKELPNYTLTGRGDIGHDSELDMLTYDRIRGDRYSYEEISFDIEYKNLSINNTLQRSK